MTTSSTRASETPGLRRAIRTGCRRGGCATSIIVVLVLWTLFLHTMGLFEDAEARAVALSTFTCLLSTIAAGARVWRKTVHVWEQQDGRSTVKLETLAGERSEAVFPTFQYQEMDLLPPTNHSKL